jgi:hypothetical protein
MNRAIITAGLAMYSKRGLFFHNASASSAAKTNAAIKKIFMVPPACYRTMQMFGRFDLFDLLHKSET